MNLSEIKQLLANLNNVAFRLENGSYVPEHFHITEVGIIEKHFIDCGGTTRKESVVNFQLWNADDDEHRLKPEKLLRIIALSEDKLGITDAAVEVEYQQDTIGKYDVGFDGETFILKNKKAACLAQDKCGTPAVKAKVRLAEISASSCCSPGNSCG